jgi:hypothetical protein
MLQPFLVIPLMRPEEPVVVAMPVAYVKQDLQN